MDFPFGTGRGYQNVSPTTSELSSVSSRRERIPDKPKNISVNLWNFLKGCVGKDLMHIPMPINFCEPLSFLQRLTEEFEYSEILDKAAQCSCPYEQLAYLAVFIISGYSNGTRITKPFNPLLGETFEFDRTLDLGWKIICEQVSHHPPIAAQYCEGRNWKLSQNFTMESKFSGNNMKVTPSGEAFVEFHNGNVFYWNKVITTIQNLIIGTIYVDREGELNIVGKNNAEGLSCSVNFISSNDGYLKKGKSEKRKIIGSVLDNHGKLKWLLEGAWDTQILVTPMQNRKSYSRMNLRGETKVAWKCNPPIQGSENYYNFSVFACQLNEMEEGIPPTDSRNRPDQRLMEEGKWTEAGAEKTRLEEKQREVAREREEKAKVLDEDGNEIIPDLPVYEPCWFKTKRNDDGTLVFHYNGQYWGCKDRQDWSKCPDIFS